MENNFSPVQFNVDLTEKLFHEFHDFLFFAVFLPKEIAMFLLTVSKLIPTLYQVFFPAINLTESYFTKKNRRPKESR